MWLLQVSTRDDQVVEPDDVLHNPGHIPVPSPVNKVWHLQSCQLVTVMADEITAAGMLDLGLAGIYTV